MFAACEYCINEKICEQDENYWMDNCERGDSIMFEPKCCENCNHYSGHKCRNEDNLIVSAQVEPTDYCSWGWKSKEE